MTVTITPPNPNAHPDAAQCAFSDPVFATRYAELAEWSRGPTSGRAPARESFRAMLASIDRSALKSTDARPSPYTVLLHIAGAVQTRDPALESVVDSLLRIAADYPASVFARSQDPKGLWWFRDSFERLVATVGGPAHVAKSLARDALRDEYLAAWGLSPSERVLPIVMRFHVVGGFMRFGGSNKPAVFLSDNAPEVYVELVPGMRTLMGRRVASIFTPTADGAYLLKEAQNPVLRNALEAVVDCVHFAREEMDEADREEKAQYEARARQRELAATMPTVGDPAYLRPDFDLNGPRRNPQVDDDADLMERIVSPRGLPNHTAPLAAGVDLDALEAAYRKDMSVTEAVLGREGNGLLSYPQGPITEGDPLPEAIAKDSVRLSNPHGSTGMSPVLDDIQDVVGMSPYDLVTRLAPVIEKALRSLTAPTTNEAEIHAAAELLHKAIVADLPEMAAHETVLMAMYRTMLRHAEALRQHFKPNPASIPAPVKTAPEVTARARIRALRMALVWSAKEFLDHMVHPPVVFNDPTEYGASVVEWETGGREVSNLEFLVLAAGFEVDPTDFANYLEGELALEELLKRRSAWQLAHSRP